MWECGPGRSSRSWRAVSLRRLGPRQDAHTLGYTDRGQATWRITSIRCSPDSLSLNRTTPQARTNRSGPSPARAHRARDGRICRRPLRFRRSNTSSLGPTSAQFCRDRESTRHSSPPHPPPSARSTRANRSTTLRDRWPLFPSPDDIVVRGVGLALIRRALTPRNSAISHSRWAVLG